MAQRIKGITIEIDGNTQGLEDSLKDVNDRSRELSKELKDVERLLKFDPDNAEALAQKQKLVAEQVENTTKKLEQLQAVEQQIEEQFNLGQISEQQFRAFRREIEFTQRQLGNLEESLEEVNRQNLKGIRRAIRDIGDAANEVKDDLKGIGEGLGGIGAGLGAGALGLVTEMQEYNEVIARIRTNAAIAGKDVEGIGDAFSRIQNPDAAAAGETLSNLLESGFDNTQLLEAIDQVNGAYIKFSDTLSTEGIADGIQETFATGVAAGSYAELLERSGIDLEKFNKQLEGTGSEAERSSLILQTMKDLGLAGVAEKYKELNPEVQAQADANTQLQKSLGELAIVFAPIVAKLTELLTKVVEWAEENPELIRTIVAIGTAIGIVVGACMALAPIFAVITGLAGFFGATVGTVSLALLGVVAVIAAVVAACIWLYQNWDMVSAKWKEGIDKINAAIEQWVADVKQRFNDQVAAAKEMVAKINQAFEDWKKGVRERFNKAIQDIKDLWNGLVSWFKGIDLSKIGRDIIQGLINGIGEMKDKVMRKAGEIAESISKKIKGALKVGSPSRVTMEIGKDTGEGLAIGLFDSIDKVAAMGGRLAESAATSINKGMSMDEFALGQYFDAIREDGDWLNDWLTHMPKQLASAAREYGKAIAPVLEGNRDPNKTLEAVNKVLNVSINSPKALDIREANREFNRTINKMSLQW